MSSPQRQFSPDRGVQFRAPIYDDVLEYRALPFHNFMSHCRMRVWKQDTGKVVVMLSEMDDNPGASVTNGIEMAATLAMAVLITAVDESDDIRVATLLDDVIFIEHYPPLDSEPADRKDRRSESFARVKFGAWKDAQFHDASFYPTWPEEMKIFGITAD